MTFTDRRRRCNRRIAASPTLTTRAMKGALAAVLFVFANHDASTISSSSRSSHVVGVSAFSQPSTPPFALSRPARALSTSSLNGTGGKGGPTRKKGTGKGRAPRKTTRRRPQVDDVLDSISDPPEFEHSVDPSAVPPGPPHLDPTAPLVRTVVHAADMRKASDIVAMRVSGCTALTSFVVFATGTSRPQNQAIAAAIADDVEEVHEGRRTVGNGVPEGSADSGWILLDYGDIMVHVMTPKSRLFYDMERTWRERGGEYMDLDDVLTGEDGPTPAAVAAALASSEPEPAAPSAKELFDVEKEDDPFWS